MKPQRSALARRRTLGEIFSVPMIVAAVSCAGLTFGLVGDGLWDILSWLLLSVPVAVCAWCALRRRRPAKS